MLTKFDVLLRRQRQKVSSCGADKILRKEIENSPNSQYNNLSGLKVLLVLIQFKNLKINLQRNQND